jgi:hypothetical protein
MLGVYGGCLEDEAHPLAGVFLNVLFCTRVDQVDLQVGEGFIGEVRVGTALG